MKRYVCIFLAMAAIAGFLRAQEPAIPKAAVPEPWKTDELPLWLRDAGRFVIVSSGSYPFALFFANEGMDFYRFFANGFDAKYTPWPFKNEYSYQPAQDEITNTLIGAGIGALAVGAADFFIHRIILHSGE